MATRDRRINEYACPVFNDREESLLHAARLAIPCKGCGAEPGHACKKTKGGEIHLGRAEGRSADLVDRYLDLIDGQPDDEDPITPEWVESIGLRKITPGTQGLLDFQTSRKDYEKLGVRMEITFSRGDKRGDFKVPRFAWMEVNGGRLWQKEHRKKQVVPTRGRVRMLLKALGIKTLEG